MRDADMGDVVEIMRRYQRNREAVRRHVEAVLEDVVPEDQDPGDLVAPFTYFVGLVVDRLHADPAYVGSRPTRTTENEE